MNLNSKTHITKGCVRANSHVNARTILILRDNLYFVHYHLAKMHPIAEDLGYKMHSAKV